MSNLSLVRYDAARSALAEAHRVDEVKDIRDKAHALAAYARQANDSEMVEWATEIKVRAERRAGQLLAEMENAPVGRPSKIPARVEGISRPPTNAEMGITDKQSSRWQKLAAVPSEQFERAVDAAKEVAREVTASGVLKAAAMGVHYTSDSPEWYTPRAIIDAAVDVLGGIDLDPCSNDHLKPNVPAKQHFTAADNGLVQAWLGSVYMNPPYGDAIGQWTAKLAFEFKSGGVHEAVALVPARTDTRWFAELYEFPCCFVNGRLKFSDSANSAPFPSAVIYLGDHPSAFSAAFKHIGRTYAAII